MTNYFTLSNLSIGQSYSFNVCLSDSSWLYAHDHSPPRDHFSNSVHHLHKQFEQTSSLGWFDDGLQKEPDDAPLYPRTCNHVGCQLFMPLEASSVRVCVPPSLMFSRFHDNLRTAEGIQVKLGTTMYKLMMYNGKKKTINKGRQTDHYNP